MRKRTVTVKNLAESAVMIALSLVLDMIVLWKMPMGGKWTLCAMLPIMLISIKNGIKYGFLTSFVYAVIQLMIGMAEVIGWGLTPTVFIGCVFFDYLLPFTALALAGVPLLLKRNTFMALAGMSLAVAVRFLMHFISGTIFFGNWSNGVLNNVIYSLVYNGQYLLPDLALTLVVSFIFLRVGVIRKTLGFYN